MGTLELRNTVKEYINTADIRLLKMMKALAETYQNNDEEPTLNEEEYKVVDRRREAHLEGRSKSYNWEQVKKNARNVTK